MITGPNQRDVEATPLYDTYQVAKAANTAALIQFFSTPTSGTKARNLTNLGRPYQINNGDLFHMRALRLVPIGMDEADIVAFMKNYTVQFILNRNQILEAPMEFWSGGAGLAGAAATTANATTIKQWSNGSADPRAIATLSPEILIDGGSTFEVDLVGTLFAATEAIFLRCYIDGLWEKA